MKKGKLSDLDKAREHFFKAATEGITGARFAIKGISGLLNESEGRKVLGDLALGFIGKGARLPLNLSNILNPVEKSKSEKKTGRKKRARKAKGE